MLASKGNCKLNNLWNLLNRYSATFKISYCELLAIDERLKVWGKWM